MNSPLDNHERRISHSLYESTEGSDNSTPLTNMIGRIGELSARFFRPPSSAPLCLFLLDKIEFFFHIDGQCGWPANLILIGYFFSLELVLLQTDIPQSILTTTLALSELSLLATPNQHHLQSLIPLIALHMLSLFKHLRD